MKKLLGIVVLGLLLSGNAHAQLITLKKCYTIQHQTTADSKGWIFNSFEEMVSSKKVPWEDQLYTLDTVTETITKTTVYKDATLDEMYKSTGEVMEKFSKDIFKITDLGGNVATAVIEKLDFFTAAYKIDVDFESAKVYTFLSSSLGKGNTTRYTQQCERQK